MSDALERYLKEHPEGVRPTEVARDVLRLSGPAASAERIARAALARIADARPGTDGRWRLAAGGEDRAVALVVRATGPHPPQDVLLEVGAALVRDGRVTDVLGTFVRPDRPIGSAALSAAGVDPAAIARGAPLAAVIDRLVPLAARARPVCFDRSRDADFLRRLAPDLLAGAGEPLVLAPPFRRAGILPVRGGIAEAAAALRVPVPETGEAGELARAIGSLYAAALDRGVPLEPGPPRARFDFGRTAFGPELLASLPERPGVYRFRDAGGTLLYVGKARDLRARVRTYFGHRAKRRKRHAELMARVHDLTFEETGSELEALLLEVAEIREHAPPYNVQREVRRRRPGTGDLVLFLPGREEGGIDLLLVRAGRPVGRVASDRRARGMRAVRAALREAFFEPAGAGNAAEEEDPADAQIVASWLRSERDAQNLVDLSEVAGIADAARLVKAYLTDPELFERRVYHR